MLYVHDNRCAKLYAYLRCLLWGMEATLQNYIENE